MITRSPSVTPAAITPMCSAAVPLAVRSRTAPIHAGDLPLERFGQLTGGKPAGLDCLAHELNVAVVNVG